jgi:hypothetical protein
MVKHILIAAVSCALLIGLSSGQEDNFKCPDEFEGFYPHLYSCDKYWHCNTGTAKLKVCGNGLVFDDIDPTYTSENCDYMHNVECGNRTDIEPAIEAPNCPRLFGTFPDPEDCTGFFNCRDGLSNRFSCAPGLAFDPKDRVCKWADQVKSCKKPEAEEDSEDGAFKCPTNTPAGIFTKHAHPEDCRQYFVCIGGTPREYGCPLGTVFKVAASTDDGKCVDPEDVPECANYYGDLEFGKQDLVRAGVDPEAVGAQVTPARARVIPARPAPAPRAQPTKFISEEESDDQAFDTELRIEDLPRPTSAPVVNEERARVRSRPPPSNINAIPITKTQQARPTPQSRPANPNPSRFTLSPSSPSTTTASPTTTTSATTIQDETTTTSPTEAPAPVVPVVEDASPAAKLQPSSLPPVTGDRQPAKVKAGDDYYYYYYYYDDDEEADGKTKTAAAAAAPAPATTA